MFPAETSAGLSGLLRQNAPNIDLGAAAATKLHGVFGTNGRSEGVKMTKAEEIKGKIEEAGIEVVMFEAGHFR